MDSKQVLATLGLTDYWEFSEGGGPGDNFWENYYLGNGHHLYLVTKLTKKSAGVPHKSTVISVSVDNETWKAQNANTNQ